jgi:KDO2-lipid IV(A) lauroyltransferase
MLLWIARLLARLPLSWLQSLGGTLGKLALVLSGDFRGKSQTNLRQAGLYEPTLMRRAADQSGQAVAETALLWFGARERIDRLIRVENGELLNQALGHGRGVILLTAHVGSFEAAALGSARFGPITVLYKPPRIDAVRTLVESGRAAPNVHPVPTTAAGVRGLLRALKRGELIGVLPDQVPSEGDGEWAPFFGRPAYTMTLPARLARLTGAQVLMAHGERLPDAAGWVVRYECLPEAPSPAVINQAMEATIRRMPEQYFWGYNRYKTPPGVVAPDAGIGRAA